MVGTIHQTVEIYTMPNTKHMAHFVSHYTSCSPKHIFVVWHILLLLKKFGIISSKAKHTRSIANAGQPKNKIPFILGIQVSECHANETECIRLQAFLQLFQYVLGVILIFVCVLIGAMVNTILEYVCLLEYLNLERIKETLAVSFQVYHKLLVYLFLQRLDVQNILFVIYLIVELAFVCIKTLPFFFMLPEPITLFGFGYGVKKGYNLLQSLSNFERSAWQTANCNLSHFRIRDFEVLFHIDFISLLSLQIKMMMVSKSNKFLTNVQVIQYKNIFVRLLILRWRLFLNSLDIRLFLQGFLRFADPKLICYLLSLIFHSFDFYEASYRNHPFLIELEICFLTIGANHLHFQMFRITEIYLNFDNLMLLIFLALAICCTNQIDYAFLAHYTIYYQNLTQFYFTNLASYPQYYTIIQFSVFAQFCLFTHLHLYYLQQNEYDGRVNLIFHSFAAYVFLFVTRNIRQVTHNHHIDIVFWVDGKLLVVADIDIISICMNQQSLAQVSLIYFITVISNRYLNSPSQLCLFYNLLYSSICLVLGKRLDLAVHFRTLFIFCFSIITSSMLPFYLSHLFPFQLFHLLCVSFLIIVFYVFISISFAVADIVYNSIALSSFFIVVTNLFGLGACVHMNGWQLHCNYFAYFPEQ